MTTFAVALAARWPAPARPIVVEADPSGGDIAMRFSLQSSPGLVSLAAAARREADSGLLWRHAQALPGGLPVVAAPPDADRARGALLALAPSSHSHTGVLRNAANAPDTVVVADCGRIDHATAAMGIVRESDVLVLLTRAHADDLAHVARRLPVVGRWTPRPVLLLVGEGYSPTEVGRELGVLPLGRVPHDEHGAAVLRGGRARLRWTRSGPSHSALGKCAHRIATFLAPTSPSLPPRIPVLPPQMPPPVAMRPVDEHAVRGGRTS
ncbi:chromosome partitioning protein [Kibdelosporangium philippinense]|uniref:Chromosome partitioning protein n=1 Tax=Kibdelosporangium philippinense TaxID=211113 RepID=A0ABS8ZRU3_9PSEU|nr:chromosome partitioning protein [Kibdelosporangium philippinense]MCE7009943.1 chromosome partitioning protein [Kibdelosporangium philippinense]